MRKTAALCLAGSLLATPLVLTSTTPAGAQSALGLAWDVNYPGNRLHSSSPTIADVDGDGVDDIVVAGLDGYVRVLRADGSPIWQSPAIVPGSSTPTAVESSPTVADLDGDGANEVIVGATSTWTPNQDGGLVVFDRAGNIRWGWRGGDTLNIWSGAGGADGRSEGAFSTPAIGDVDGDGKNDIVFGGFDSYLHALDRNGNELPGFPMLTDDTVWSSPALYDIDNDGRHEIFVGIDGTAGGPVDHTGGLLWAVDFRNGGPALMWERRIGEVIHGSPAIGDVNGDGRLEVVSTTGTFYGSGDGNHVWAWHADDGSTVPGWPVATSGQTVASPALGDVDGNGVADVVVGTRAGLVHAYRGDGSQIWGGAPNGAGEGGGEIVASPIIADLDGNGSQDVAVGNGWGTFLLRGSDGARLYAPLGIGWSYHASAAVGSFGNAGSRIVIAGFQTNGVYDPGVGHLFTYQLPTQGAAAAWPMFHRAPNHVGAPPSGGDPLPAAYCRRPVNPAGAPDPGAAQGYWFLGRDGGIFSFGNVDFHGSLPGIGVSTPAAAMSARADGSGYWIVDRNGIVHAFGAAPFIGDMRDVRLNSPIIGLEPTPSGNGYWLLAGDGGVFAFGDAQFLGSTGNLRLNSPIIAMRSHPSGEGYWLLGSDGGVFSFGNVTFHGSTGGMRLNAPVLSMAVHPSGDGYWLLGGDGGVFSFGTSAFQGSIPGIGLCSASSAVQIRTTATGNGYWLLGSDGGVFSFGDAFFYGSYPGLTGASAAVDMAIRN